MDITRYDKVIRDVLRHLRVPKPQQDDLIQECYLALLENESKLPERKEDDPERGYEWTVCKNRILNVWKSEKYRSSFESLDIPYIRRLAIQLNVSDTPKAVEKLEDALESLTERQWAVIYGLYAEGKTQQEVGRDMGISQVVVSRHKALAIKKLRKSFGIS